MHLAQHLRDQHVAFETLVHPPAYSAQRRAHYLRLSGKQVVKNVLLQGPGGYVLAILPATRRIDLARVAAHLGGPVRLASEDEITERFANCEWGVTAPLGTVYGLPTLLDDSLSPDSTLVFELQFRAESVRLSCQAFETLEHPQRLMLSRQEL